MRNFMFVFQIKVDEVIAMNPIDRENRKNSRDKE